MITIARSSLNDYCTPDQVDMIQSLMEDVIKACFGDKKELNHDHVNNKKTGALIKLINFSFTIAAIL